MIKLMFTQCSTLSATGGGVAKVLWTQVDTLGGQEKLSGRGKVEYKKTQKS